MKFCIPPSILCLVCLSGLVARPLLAQESLGYEREPQGLEQDFLLRIWETADGLLPTNVRSIAQNLSSRHRAKCEPAERSAGSAHRRVRRDDPLVDDEKVVLKVARTMLEKLGYKVDDYADSAAALEAFSAAPHRYRLLITDFAMPQLDGLELARRVWALNPGFSIILYSGYGGSITPEEALKMGFAQLLPKPFDLRGLADAVTHALRAGETDGGTTLATQGPR